MNVRGGLGGREELGDDTWFKKGRGFDGKGREDVEGMKMFKLGCLEGNGVLGSGWICCGDLDRTIWEEEYTAVFCWMLRLFSFRYRS